MRQTMNRDVKEMAGTCEPAFLLKEQAYLLENTLIPEQHIREKTRGGKITGVVEKALKTDGAAMEAQTSFAIGTPICFA